MRAKHREAAAYGLGVLDDPEEFETHLDDCPRCRELLAGFDPVSEALAEAARLGYLPGGGSPSGGSPAPVGSGPPASGGSGSPAVDAPVRGGPAETGYPPRSDDAATRRRKPCVSGSRPDGDTGTFLLLGLGMAVTALRSTRPATARTWFAFAASIVSPAQVVAGTGGDLRDLPWRAGFQ